MTTTIRVRGLEKSFGDLHVLRGVDLDVETGSVRTFGELQRLLPPAQVEDVAKQPTLEEVLLAIIGHERAAHEQENA